jgi:hypothetical protein
MMTRRNVLRAVWQAGANAYGGGNRETGKVPIFFAFASPVAVLVVGSCIFATLSGDRALIAQLAGASFTAGTGLRAFSFWREKERCSPLTRCEVGPMFRIFHCYWSGNLDCSDFRE